MYSTKTFLEEIRYEAEQLLNLTKRIEDGEVLQFKVQIIFDKAEDALRCLQHDLRCLQHDLRYEE